MVSKPTCSLIQACHVHTIENVTFFEYGLIGLNLLGRSFLNNMVINLTITMTGTYLNYHGIVLYYSSLQSGNFDNYSIACTLNTVSICGYGSKHLLYHINHIFEITCGQ